MLIQRRKVIIYLRIPENLILCWKIITVARQFRGRVRILILIVWLVNKLFRVFSK